MAHWHPPIDTAASWRAHYERWRDVHGPLSAITEQLRKRISRAVRNEQLTKGQRVDLLGVIAQIDDERRGR
jgi:hypothetical protein